MSNRQQKISASHTVAMCVFLSGPVKHDFTSPAVKFCRRLRFHLNLRQKLPDPSKNVYRKIGTGRDWGLTAVDGDSESHGSALMHNDVWDAWRDHPGRSMRLRGSLILFGWFENPRTIWLRGEKRPAARPSLQWYG